MHSERTVREVFTLAEAGWTHAAIARATQVDRGLVASWISRGLESTQKARAPHDSDRCDVLDGLDARTYAYVLGQYLGDGCVTVAPSLRSARLRISCCDDYPAVRSEVGEGMEAISRRGTTYARRSDGCTDVGSSWIHWPCILPHGPGRKHQRPVVLRQRQRELALERAPGQLLRGLIHSDGSRYENRVVRTLADGTARHYRYATYAFTNRSADILRMFEEACAEVGVRTRRSGRFDVVVSRRPCVALLDELIGPKR